MRCQALLSDFRIDNFEGRMELRIDWDNDRHQAVALMGADAESLKDALLRAAQMLNSEINAGRI